MRRLVLIDRHAPALPLRDTVFHGVDLTATLADVALAEILARERVDTVIHAAFHDVPRRNLEAAHELEVLGTRALFRADRRQRAPRGYGRQRGRARDDDELRGARRQSAVSRGGRAVAGRRRAIPSSPTSSRSRARWRRCGRVPGLPVAMMRLAPTVGDERTLLARLLAPAAVPAVIGTDPLVQVLDLDDLVEAVRAGRARSPRRRVQRRRRRGAAALDHHQAERAIARGGARVGAARRVAGPVGGRGGSGSRGARGLSARDLRRRHDAHGRGARVPQPLRDRRCARAPRRACAAAACASRPDARGLRPDEMRCRPRGRVL